MAFSPHRQARGLYYKQLWACKFSHTVPKQSCAIDNDHYHKLSRKAPELSRWPT